MNPIYEQTQKKNNFFVFFMLLSFIFCSQVFGAGGGGFDFFASISNAFTKIFEEQVLGIGIALIFAWGVSLIVGGVPITRAILYMCMAGACLALATKAGPWFASFAGNFEGNYGTP